MPNLDRATLDHLYTQMKLTTGQIVATTGVPATTVTRLRKQWGIPTLQRAESFVGQRFGRLTVLAEVRDRSATCRCRCDCGTEIEVKRGNLQQGRTTSCGCFRSELHRRPDGKAVAYSIIREYRLSARRRNLDWVLDDPSAFSLFEGDCYYCGQPPTRTRDGKPRRMRGSYTFNGIDRKNRSEGYTPENTVSCCPTCNYAKGKLEAETFLTHVLSIHPTIDNPQGCSSDKETGWAFSHYRVRAKSLNLPFDLSREEVRELVSTPCIYCGAEGHTRKGGFRRNGIDRINSAGGYTKDNCVPCCWLCNQIKGRRDVEAFLGWVASVKSYRGSISTR